MSRRVLLLAGEESGVLYARQIAAALRRTDGAVEIRGYADYGFETADLAVFGIWEVIRHIFFFMRVKRTMERAIREWRPDVVCTVDYPGMNLKLAAYAKSRGVKAVHVVCPQVWAWRRDRIPRIERSLDRLCCFFPFEPALFREGFAAFVGHPLAEEFVREEASAASRPPSEGRTLAILPGSRVGEIGRILPPLVEAARVLMLEMPDLAVAIPAANARARAEIVRLLAAAAPLPREPEILDGGARDLLRRATAAAVASGTATLEAALAGCPTVLVYRVGAVLAAIMRLVITGVRHVGLANIVWEKSGGDESRYPMPELLQEAFTPERVVAELRPYLASEASRAEAVSRLEAAVSLISSSGGAMDKIAGFCYNIR